MGHVVMENRNGLVVAAEMTAATGTAEREAAVAMVEEMAGGRRMTLGADRAYDTADFVAGMRRLGVTPHVSQNSNGRHRRPHHASSRRSACACASASRKCSAGSRRWAGCARRVTAARRWSGGCSRWRQRRTTWCGSPSFWLPPCSHARSLSRGMIPARQHSRNPENAARKPPRPSPDRGKTRSFEGFSAAC